MIYLEYALWSWFILYPIYIYLSTEKERQAVISNKLSRVSVYRQTMFYLWLPTCVLLFLAFNGHIDLATIGFKWQWNLANQIALAVTIAVLVVCIVSIKAVANSAEHQKSVREQTKTFNYFMPSNKKELNVFNWGVCVTAGICEEILFRGYLLAKFNEVMPIYAAVALSAIVFGLPHIYQGVAGVVRTALWGTIFILIYLLTDSLLFPIVLHIIADVYSGWISYLAYHQQPPQEPRQLA